MPFPLSIWPVPHDPRPALLLYCAEEDLFICSAPHRFYSVMISLSRIYYNLDQSVHNILSSIFYPVSASFCSFEFFFLSLASLSLASLSLASLRNAFALRLEVQHPEPLDVGPGVLLLLFNKAAICQTSVCPTTDSDICIRLHRCLHFYTSLLLLYTALWSMWRTP